VDRVPGIRPRPTLIRRLDAAGRMCFPAVSTAVLLLLLAAPLRLPAQAELQLALLLGCVFFWSLHRPATMPPPVVFLLGVLAELLGDGPIGVTVLVLLLMQAIVLRARYALARQGLPMVWLVFVALAVSAVATNWAVASLLALQLLPPGPALFQALIAAGIYPAFALLLTRAHRGIAAPEEA
jgi:rod shape-determining protein MreD